MRQDDFDQYDKAFEKWRESHSGKMFSDYSLSRLVSTLKKGHAHPTLGANLVGKAEWATAGRTMFETILGLSSISPDARICEYGCGSLRVTHHFIRRQDPGCVFGLDVIPHFIQMGKQLMGQEVFVEKKPILGIRSAALQEAISFEADLVYATSVARHVHPEEKPTFFKDLIALSRKVRCAVIFDAWLMDRPTRFARSGWAWPLTFYIENMSPLVLQSVTPCTATRNLLTFVREADLQSATLDEVHGQ